MVELRSLTFAPDIDEAQGRLRARTGLLFRVLTLGLFAREVVVDSRARYVIVVDRWLWLVRRTRTIPFKHIHRIEYDYEAPSRSFARDREGAVHRGDDIDDYRVSLVLRARTDVPDTHAHLYEERLVLFGFRSDGHGVGSEGQQQCRSQAYVERLRALTGAGFGHELPAMKDELGQTWRCQGCGRDAPPRRGRCYYCGGDLAPG